MHFRRVKFSARIFVTHSTRLHKIDFMQTNKEWKRLHQLTMISLHAIVVKEYINRDPIGPYKNIERTIMMTTNFKYIPLNIRYKFK